MVPFSDLQSVKSGAGRQQPVLGKKTVLADMTDTFVVSNVAGGEWLKPDDGLD